MSDKPTAEELVAYQRIAALELSNAQLEQRWSDQKRMLNTLLEERGDLCSKLSMIGISLQPDNTLINKAFVAPTIPDNEIIEWVRGFHEAGHFISEEACNDFADQLKNLLEPLRALDDSIDAFESQLLAIRKNLIHVLDLDEVMAFDERKHEARFHEAMINYAQRNSVDVDYDYARQLGDSFKLGPSFDKWAPDAMAECLVAYRELIKPA